MDDGMEVELPPEVTPEVELLPDGGAMVDVSSESRQVDSEFIENLSEKFSETYLNELASELLGQLELDRESRSDFDKRYADGLKMTGMDGQSTVGADFEGASKAVHPVLIEAAIEFNARTIKELLPPNGPTRSKIIGEQTKDKLDRAERKCQYMNWQITRKMREYRREMEQLLTQLSLAGSQFSGLDFDATLGRPVFEYIPSDQIILPFHAASWEFSERKARILRYSKQKFESKVKAGVYSAVSVSAGSILSEETKTQEEVHRIEGKTDSGMNEDGVRVLYEVYIQHSCEEDTYTKGDCAPYIITIDEVSQRVVGMYRNWDEKDELRNEIPRIIEWPCIPFRGALTSGLVHLIGGLAVAATGALNGLLDSAHVNNIPTAIALKGAKMTGQTAQVEPTTIHTIEGPAGVDDIRRLAMPMPYNPPSTVLFSLLGFLVEGAKSVVSTASERLADASNTGPVGTTFALIEQGAIVFSSIFARLHEAHSRVLEQLHRINSIYLNDQEVVEELGELTVSSADFNGPMDIQLVSDPSIFSETQRWAQNQTVLQMSADARVQYNVRAIHERILKLMNYPSIEEVLPKTNEPEQINAVAENINAVRGQPLLVFPAEDDLSHIKVHLSFVLDESMKVLSTPAVTPLFGHIQQHLLQMYSKFMTKLADSAVGGSIDQYLVDSKLAPKVDGLLAEAVPHAHELWTQITQPLMQGIMQLAQMAQEQAQQQQNVPLDPQSQVALQIGQAEIARKTQVDQANMQLRTQDQQAKLQLNQTDVQQKASLAQGKMQLEAQKLNQEREYDVGQLQVEVKKNADDNVTKERISAMEIAMKQALEDKKLNQQARESLLKALMGPEKTILP